MYTKGRDLKKRLKIQLLVFCCTALFFGDGQTSASTYSELKTECIEIIKEGLLNKSETIRLDSLSNIERLSLFDSVIEKRILEISSVDQSEVVRAAAISILSSLKGKSAIDIFKRALEVRGPQAYLIHIAAAAALYNLGEKDALEIILRYLDSKNKAASIEAGIIMGTLKNGDIIPLLRARLDTNNQHLKNILLESLARLGDKIPEKEINSLLESEQADSQWTALNIIKVSRDKKFKGQLNKKLTSNNPITRIRAAKVITLLGGANKKSIITEYLLSNKNDYSGISSEDVRVVAMFEGLSEIGNVSDLPLLKKFLKKNGRERIMAAGAIIAILNKKEKGK